MAFVRILSLAAALVPFGDASETKSTLPCGEQDSAACRTHSAPLAGGSGIAPVGDIPDVEEEEAIAVLRMSLLQTSLHISREHVEHKERAKDDAPAAHAPLPLEAVAVPGVPAAAPQKVDGVSAVAADTEVEVPAVGVDPEAERENEVPEVNLLPGAKFALLETSTVSEEKLAAAKTAEVAEAGKVPPSKIIIPESIAAGRHWTRSRSSADVEAEEQVGSNNSSDGLIDMLESSGSASVDRAHADGGGTSSQQALRPSLSVSLLSEILDPAREGVSGLPMLLICMLAFLVGTVFLIQVVGWTLEEKDTSGQGNDRRLGVGFRGGMPRPPRLDAKGSPAPSPYLYASAPGSAYGLQGAHTGSFDALPTDTGTLKGRSWSAPSATGTPNYSGNMGTGFFGAPDEPGLMDRPSTAPDTRRSIEVAQDAICPALILPHGEARFSIPQEGMHKLGVGRYPVEILGPSGRPLLHARLPVQPAGGRTDIATGRWLELTTTATSRYPHACIGPVQLGRLSQQALEIRGPKGNAYGMLEPHGGGWCARRAGRIVLRIATSADGGLQALSADSMQIASAIPEPGAQLTIQVHSGVDALLTLLCLLTVVLMSPDLAGMSS